MEGRLRLNLEQLSLAAGDFDRSLGIELSALDPIIADAVRNGQAQKFEFTIELFWKTTKVFLLERHGFDIVSPKAAIKKYFELGFIGYEDCERLLGALDIRNSLSHVYKKEAFLALHAEILGYTGFFEKVARGMQEVNA